MFGEWCGCILVFSTTPAVFADLVDPAVAEGVGEASAEPLVEDGVK